MEKNLPSVIKFRQAKEIRKQETTQPETAEASNSIQKVEPEYCFESLAKIYELNSTANKCINLIAKNIVGKGFKISSKDGDNKDNKQVLNMTDIFKNISPEKSFNQFLREAMIDLICTGNAAIEVSRDGSGMVQHMYNVPIDTIRYLKGKEWVFRTWQRYVMEVETSLSKNRLTYFNRYYSQKEMRTSANGYADLNGDGKKTNEIIRLKLDNPMSKFYGLSASVTLLKKYLVTKLAEEYNIGEFENGLLSKFVISVKNGTITQESMNAFSEYLSDITSGQQWSSVPILNLKGNGADISIDKIGAEVKEWSYLDLLKFNRQEIYVAFGVPPVMLGITENSNRATALEEERKFYESEIEPIQKDLEELFNRMIENDFGYERLQFKFVVQDMRDFEVLNKIVEDGQKSGRYSINDAKSIMGEEMIDVEGANMRFKETSMGLVNIEDLGSLSNEAADRQGKSMGEAVVENIFRLREKIASKIQAEKIMTGTEDKKSNGESYPWN